MEAVVLGLLAGAAIPAGALIARVEGLRPHWLENELRHSVIAFGGGVLIAAVALVLVPSGAEALSGGAALAAFLAGGVAMAVLGARRGPRGGTLAAQSIAMVSDFVPEALALGAMLAAERGEALLLALLIGLQNLPEGFNAYREQVAEHEDRAPTILRRFVLLALLGPVAALAGVLWLGALPAVTGAIMLAAAGAILFLMFQDIAPAARLEGTMAPPIAAVAGFAMGLAGQVFIG